MENNIEIVPNGTEVLIFKYISTWERQDEEHFIMGKIVGHSEVYDLPFHVPYAVDKYEVIGEDGNKYYGCYGTPLLGNSFFRTIEDHIKCVERKIEDNKEKIDLLYKTNENYKNYIIGLKKLNSIRTSDNEQSESNLSKKLEKVKRFNVK